MLPVWCKITLLRQKLPPNKHQDDSWPASNHSTLASKVKRSTTEQKKSARGWSEDDSEVNWSLMKKVLSKNLLIIVGPLVAANVPDNRPPFHPSSRRPVAIQQQVQLPWWSSLFLTLSLSCTCARTHTLSLLLSHALILPHWKLAQNGQ